MEPFALLRRGLKFHRPASSQPAQSSTKATRTDNNRAKSRPQLDFFSSAPTRQVEEEAAEDDDAEEQHGEHVDAPQAMSEEFVGELRRNGRIHVKGSDVPPPINSFADLEHIGVQKPLVEALLKQYSTPTPIQMQAIPALHQQRDVLGVAPTGSGKTLAYLLPVLAALAAPKATGVRACILSPTRELAQQIKREADLLCDVLKLRVRLLTQGAANAVVKGQQPAFDVLVSTPLKLVHSLQQGEIKLDAVEWLIVDEADRLFENGYEHQLDEIIAACTNKRRRLALFSATMPDRVETLAQSVLDNYIRITVGARFAAAATVQQELIFVGSEEGKMMAFRQLLQKGLKPPVLIFVQSKLRAQQLFDELVYENINVDAIHADCTAQQRDLAVKHFREGKIWVLICTDLMGRGLDFKGVNMVINYDFPPNPTEYIHRVGRTGRAGHEGHAISFFTTDDGPMLRNIANVIRNSGGEVPEWMLELQPLELRKLKGHQRVISRAPITADPKVQRQAHTEARLKAKKLERLRNGEDSEQPAESDGTKPTQAVEQLKKTKKKGSLKKLTAADHYRLQLESRKKAMLESRQQSARNSSAGKAAAAGRKGAKATKKKKSKS